MLLSADDFFDQFEGEGVVDLRVVLTSSASVNTRRSDLHRRYGKERPDRKKKMDERPSLTGLVSADVTQQTSHARFEL